MARETLNLSMKKRLLVGYDAVIALLMASWVWLTPRARFYKVSVWTICVLVLLTSVDEAFVLPGIEGWLAVVSFGGVLAILGAMAWRWSIDESVDVPRRWIAPVRQEPKG